jgi:hypothetical protein
MKRLSLFSVAHQVGLVEEAGRRSVAAAILFMATPDQRSVEAYRSLRDRFAQAMWAPVHNEMFGPAQHRDKYPLVGGSSVMVRLPVLAPGLRRYIETPPFAFADSNVGAAVGIPLDAHIELQRWLRRIYLEFRELDLHIFAGFNPARRLNLFFFGNRGGLGAFLSPDSRARANGVGGTPCGLHYLRSSSASRFASLWERWLWNPTRKMLNLDGVSRNKRFSAADGPPNFCVHDSATDRKLCNNAVTCHRPCCCRGNLRRYFGVSSSRHSTIIF